MENNLDKITAVNWLENELAKNLKSIIKNQDYKLMEEIFDKARKKEAKQIIEARISAPIIHNTLDINDYIQEAETYYKNKYE